MKVSTKLRTTPLHPGAREAIPRETRSRAVWRTQAMLLVAIVAVLWGTTDDREAGLIADGRQMIFTAIAIAETGSLGQARDRDLTVPRPGGDSVSRYGLAMSVAQVPAAALAPRVEARMGAGTSQPLFLIAPWLCVLGAALLAGIAARELGAGRRGEAIAILLSSLASPLGAYAALELSEPLQALALTAAFALALSARRAIAPAIAAGACVGLAVFTKSSLLLVAPFTLIPLFTSPRERRWRLVAAAAAGFTPVAGVWLYFEIARFGRPLASYAGEGFTHPFWDGAWRLLAGVNKGIVFYFPAFVVAVSAVVRALRGRAPRSSIRLGAVLPFAALLILAAPWWAWHGVDGWGPRLLVPAIPLLAACAAIDIERWRRAARVALMAVSIAVNTPPLLQHPTPVTRYMWKCAWPAADRHMADALPRFARREEGGRVIAPPDQVLASVPWASPFIVLPWFFNASRGDPRAIAAHLQSPPWVRARPDIVPSPPLAPEEAAAIARPPRWNFWGRSFAASGPDLPFAVYDAGLTDQVLRAQQLRHLDDALRLSRKLIAIAPSGLADALLLESDRLLGRRQEAIDWLTHLPSERRLHPAINLVLALWDRDDGKDAEARALLQSSAPSYPAGPIQTALTAPLSTWPPDFATLTADPGIGVPLAR